MSYFMVFFFFLLCFSRRSLLSLISHYLTVLKFRFSDFTSHYYCYLIPPLPLALVELCCCGFDYLG